MQIQQINYTNSINTKGYKKQVRKVFTEKNLAYWNFITNSTPENIELLKKINEKMAKLEPKSLLVRIIIFLNKEIKTTKKEDKKVENNDFVDISVLENNLIEKFNSLKFDVLGKKVGLDVIKGLIQIEENNEKRADYYKIFNETIEPLTEDFKKLVIERNKFAQKRGYKNYYDFMSKYYKNFNISSLIENIYSEGLIEEYAKIRDDILCKIHGKEKREDLKPYDYVSYRIEQYFGDEINNHIGKKEDYLEKVKFLFSKLGFDINKYEEKGLLQLDLFDRENKKEMNACFIIEPLKDIRITTKLRNDISSLKILIHEMMHAMYNFGISKFLPFMNKKQDQLLGESLSMMMELLPEKEDVLLENVPEEIKEKHKKADKFFKFGNIANLSLEVEFEKQIYENPDKDFKQLWNELSEKYLYRPKEENPKDNSWLKSILIRDVAYRENYLLAMFLREQIYSHLKEVSNGKITENKNIAEYLRKNLYKYGKYYSTKKLIKKFLKEELSSEAFKKHLKENLEQLKIKNSM